LNSQQSNYHPKEPFGETYSAEETVARAEAALKRMLNTPPKLHSEMKIGKRKAKAGSKANPLKKRGPKKAD
jgi:hypothetical protein